MAVKVDGLNDIFGVIDNLGEVGKKSSKKAVRSGLNEVVKVMKTDAPNDTGEGRRKLSVDTVKTNKNGSAWGKAGIHAKNWKEVSHLYYQHYGYIHYKSGKKVEVHAGWMDKIYEKSKSKAEEKMMNTLSSEIDKVLK